MDEHHSALEQKAKAVLQECRSQGVERKIHVYPDDYSQCKTAHNFSSNDYLNLSGQSELLRAAAEVQSSGARASRLVTGTTAYHARLEHELANFKGYEGVLLYGSGYLANVGVLSALFSRNDLVFADKLIHASLIDGIRLSEAKMQRFAHNNLEHLESLLSKAAKDRKRDTVFAVVTESVFSMDGDLAPLREIANLARSFDAVVLVDEAHAFGVFGREGRGVVDEMELEREIFLSTGTLSKALGCYGGFAATSNLFKELLINKSRAFIYSTALPPTVVASASAALALIREKKELGRELQSRAKLFRELLKSAGLNVLDSQSQIIPLLVGDNERTVALAHALLDRGIVVHAMRAPTVPVGTARLRFSVTLAHTVETLRQSAAIVIEEAGRIGVAE